MSTKIQSGSQAEADVLKAWQTAAVENLTNIQSAESKPTPIPLRTLTTLLNFERCIANPRFQKAMLIETSFVNPNALRPQPAMLKALRDVPSNKETHIHMFTERPADVPAIPYPCITISPDAPTNVKNMTDKLKELIYYEIHGHDGCSKSATLFQAFFDLCPKNQQVSIQVGEEPPVLLNPFARKVLNYNMKGPKLFSAMAGFSYLNEEGRTIRFICSGQETQNYHAIVGFAAPGSLEMDYVVDMSRMQYGNAGRGLHGEPYYLGHMSGWLETIANSFESVEQTSSSVGIVSSDVLDYTELAKACAERVWKRWQNRDYEGWCAYCGVGNTTAYPLLNCGGCKIRKVQYCCREHQLSDWKLHKMTCEKVKK